MRMIRGLPWLGMLLAAAVATPLLAQDGGKPAGEPRGFDFRPDGAWRKQAKQVAASRRIALARGDLRFLNSPSASAAVTGDYKLPVVFVNFSDTVAAGFQLDTAAYDRLFFSATPNTDSRPYSVKTYYEEISNDNITIDGDVYGWINVPAPFTKLFVGQNCHGVFPGCTASSTTHFGAWLKAALDSLNTAGHQVDWSQYDQNADGVVDFVTFIHPTIGGECTSISQASDIWAHRFYLSAFFAGGYTTKTPRPGHPGQFMVIDDYIIQSSRGGNSGCSAASMMPMGTVAHETGHAFGIPDLYDTSPSGADEGIGEWGLMGSGNYARPYSPSGMEAWSLMTLGWITVATPGTGSISLGPVQTSDTIYRVPLGSSDEFLLLENRQSLLSDTAQMNPGLSSPPGKNPGLLVWHIDQSVIDGGLGTNSVNAGVRKGTQLLQADGLNQLQTPGANNRGDRGDPFPGSSNITSVTAATNPGILDETGRISRSITAITQVTPNGAMSFTLSPTQFKLRALVTGSGTVTSSGGGNIGTGVFVDSATTTTLTAHVGGGGAIFTGWTGDTTGSDSVMVLPTRRPYNVTAGFTGAVDVTEDEATNAILGQTPLTAPQAAYLDSVGNNNGVYDLGDYLAYLKAHGVVPSPEVMRQLGRGKNLAPRRGN